MEVLAEARRAAERIRPWVRRTPVEPSPWLSERTGARVFLKLENHQRTGSFKLRGAMSRLTALSDAERSAGVVAASTGNHGAAVALGASLVGTRATVFAPRTAQPAKLAAIEAAGATTRLVGQDCIEAERAARTFATECGATYVSPYNDELVVAGQGTLGLELLDDLPDVDVVLLAAGGGGLLAGVGGVLKALRPSVHVVGASPAASAVLAASVAAGRVLEDDSAPTLSDATAGGLEEGSITLELCRAVADRFVTVDEAAIAEALREVIARHHTLIEGAAAVPVAALLASGRTFADRTVAVVLCGANIAPAVLKEVL